MFTSNGNMSVKTVSIMFILFYLTSILGSGFLMHSLINSINVGDQRTITLNNTQYIISMTALSLYIALHIPCIYLFFFK